MIQLRQLFTTWKYRASALLAAAVLLAPISSIGTAFAAGSASFSLSPTSASYNTNATFTVAVNIIGSNVSGGTANVSYDTTYLQCQSIAVGGSFDVYIPSYETCGSGTANISALSSNAPLNGSQLFATITFKTTSTATPAGTPAVVKIVAGSGGGATQIDDNSSTNIWDGGTPSANFTVTAPSSGGGGTTSGGGSTSSGGGSSGGGGSKSSGSGSTGSSSSGTSSTTTPPAITTTPTVPVTTSAPKNCSLNITITGKNGKPIANAKVLIDNHYSEYTDAQGKAGFTGLASGSHNVTVSGAGKTTQQTRLTLDSGETKAVSVKLASTMSPLLLVVYAVAGLAILGGVGIGALKLRGRGGGIPALRGMGGDGNEIHVGGTSYPPQTTPVSVTPPVQPLSSNNAPVAGSTVKPSDPNSTTSQQQ